MYQVKSIALFLSIMVSTSLFAQSKEVAYIVSDIKIPFWEIMSKGINSKAEELGYKLKIYNADNKKGQELKNTAIALKSKELDGIIISPINSSTASTILKLASRHNTPVVISDIGTTGGEYVSFISSNNYDGAYKLGKILSKKMIDLNWHKEGTVGIVAIPQKRANGKARTNGFFKAMKETNIKVSNLLQQLDFSYEETYKHTKTLIKNDPNLKAIWLQGSDKYQAALDAIKDSGKENKILLICFDAEEEFLELIPKGVIIGSAMQQPYLMGQKAMESLDLHLNGKKVKKESKLNILDISSDNIQSKLPIIKRNVLGIE